MKETELAAHVVSWLSEQNWEVYQEVQFRRSYGVADIVAVRNRVLWIIESKMSYGFQVLEQATQWVAQYRSVAVPRSMSPRNYRVARDYYRVGVLEVDVDGYVYEIVGAPLFVRDYKKTDESISLLTDLHKTFALAGSQSGHHLTPYRQTMIDVKAMVSKNPGCTVGFLYDHLGEMHYSSKASFKGNLIKALERFEPWCRIDYSVRPYKLYIKS